MPVLTFQEHETRPLTSAQVQTISIPGGGKIQSIILNFLLASGLPASEAQIRGEVGNIRLTMNGRDIVNCSALQLYDVYEMLGKQVGVPAGIAGSLELNIGRILFTDPILRNLFGFGTADVPSIQVQVTAGTLANVASVRCYTQREQVAQNLGAHCRLINYVQNFNATGDHTVDTLPRDLDSSYFGVFADDGASGTIGFGQCRVNNANVYDRISSSANDLRLSSNGYSPVAGYYPYNFMDGSGSGRIPMIGVTDLRFVTTFTVAPGAAGYNMLALTGVNVPNV